MPILLVGKPLILKIKECRNPNNPTQKDSIDSKTFPEKDQINKHVPSIEEVPASERKLSAEQLASTEHPARINKETLISPFELPPVSQFAKYCCSLKYQSVLHQGQPSLVKNLQVFAVHLRLNR